MEGDMYKIEFNFEDTFFIEGLDGGDIYQEKTTYAFPPHREKWARRRRRGILEAIRNSALVEGRDFFVYSSRSEECEE